MHPIVNIIQIKVSEIYGLSREDIFGTSRKPELVEPRHIAIHIARLNKDQIGVLSIIAEQFGYIDGEGNGNHEAIIYASKKVIESLETYKPYKEKYDQTLLIVNSAIETFLSSGAIEQDNTYIEGLKDVLRTNISKLQTSPSFTPQATAINEAIKNIIELNKLTLIKQK